MRKTDREHRGSAALLEADAASEEDASGLAADGQEEGEDKGKGKTKLFALGKTKLRPIGPSKPPSQASDPNIFLSLLLQILCVRSQHFHGVA